MLYIQAFQLYARCMEESRPKELKEAGVQGADMTRLANSLKSWLSSLRKENKKVEIALRGKRVAQVLLK